jgi:hypothetical protein
MDSGGPAMSASEDQPGAEKTLGNTANAADSKGKAERMGFEPTVQGDTPYNGLANRRLQPLGHLSRGFQDWKRYRISIGVSTGAARFIFAADAPPSPMLRLGEASGYSAVGHRDPVQVKTAFDYDDLVNRLIRCEAPPRAGREGPGAWRAR